MTTPGKLFIISAPSGAGKTTLLRKVLPRFENLSYSVSHTTRDPRGEEKEGRDYYFISSETFENRIKTNAWLEWAKVHDNYYGTSKAFVMDRLEKGEHLLLDIDVQGAEQIMASDMKLVSIFIMPPSLEVLSLRLKDRGTDKAAVIETRLNNAKMEIRKKDRYHYILVNDDLDEAVEALGTIIENEMS